METMKLFLRALPALCVHGLVRISRAVDSALWEICPSAYRWFRDTADLAHKHVRDEQEWALARSRGEDDEPEAQPAPAYAAALVPPDELPSTGPFASFSEWEAACDAHNKRADDIRARKRRVPYSSPEYVALSDEFARNNTAWTRCINAQPRGTVRC